MDSLFFLILILISVVSVLIGFVLNLKPEWAIQIQKKFYEKINWRIEPISMKKEIRNTRIMGIFLIIISLLTIIYIFIKMI
jgi:hypothetical protein